MRNSLKKRLFAHLYSILVISCTFALVPKKKLFTVLLWFFVNFTRKVSLEIFDKSRPKWMNYSFFCIQLIINNYQNFFEKDFIYYNIIAIKWGESTHFTGRTGNRCKTTRYLLIHGSKESRSFRPNYLFAPESELIRPT